MKSAFVTVGTTSHPRLIQQLSRPETLQELADQGYGRLVVQAGGSPVPQQLASNAQSAGICADIFAFRESILSEIQAADLVIAHAGAGTAIEVLRCGKPLIVVVNECLMDNHQTELAEALRGQGYLLSCYPEALAQSLRSVPDTRFEPFPEPNASAFRHFLDGVLFPDYKM